MYKLKLSRAELDSLAWVGDRYESAGILYDGLILADTEFNNQYFDSDIDGEFTWHIPEHIAWEYMESLETENGCGQIVPTCIGGKLAEKLIELYERIV